MIIIPDIHGRTFWKEPVTKALETGESIIFLGDYVDPYEYEGVPMGGLVPMLERIISIKREHPGQVTLLLGNHDLHYLSEDLGGSRYDYSRAVFYVRLFRDNSELFQMAAEAEIGGQKFLFSHAGVKRGWLDFEDDYLGKLAPEDVCSRLNEMWIDKEQRPALLDILADISTSRWGAQPYGSPVWNDVEDMADDADELPGYYQIFGHSQQEENPVIGEHFACLDCRRAFIVNDKGSIQEL